MPTLEERIKEFNELEYRDQCRYIVNKLISLEYIGIMHTVFFKRLQIILRNLPLIYLRTRNTNNMHNQNHIYKYEFNVQFYPQSERIFDDILYIRYKSILDIHYDQNYNHKFYINSKRHGRIKMAITDEDIQKDGFAF